MVQNIFAMIYTSTEEVEMGNKMEIKENRITTTHIEVTTRHSHSTALPENRLTAAGVVLSISRFGIATIACFIVFRLDVVH
jgi:hypothetical protein